MNDDILIPSPDSPTPADIDTQPEGEEVSRGDQVFDISEDNISPIRDEVVMPAANQKFQLRKVLPKAYVAPKPAINPRVVAAPTVQVPPKTPTTPPITQSAPNSTTESPTKNVLDPHYVAPGVFATNSTPVTKPTPKIKLPPLPEIPAFKGTFDTKPHTFNPTVAKSPTLQQNFPNTTPVEEGMGAVTPTPRPVQTPVTATSAIQTPTTGGPTLAKPLNQTIPGQAKPFVSAFSTPLSEPETLTNPVAVPVSTSIPAEKSAIPLAPETTLPKAPLSTTTSAVPKNPILATASASSAFVRGQSPANPAAKTLGYQPVIQQPSKIQAPENTNLKNLRTYESDVAEILAHKQVSKASIAIAANTQKEVPTETEGQSDAPAPATSHNTLKLILILLSAFFIGVGLFGAYYLYSKSVFVPLKSPDTQQEPSGALPSSDIIPVDNQTKVDIRGLTSSAITQKIRAEIDKPQTPNTIRELVLTNGNVQVSSSEMISRSNLEMPDILARSFTPLWTLGVYADEMGNKDVFVIATTQFFQNTFAGMLQWEKLMVDDLKSYLPVSARSTIPSPTETGTSSSATATSTPPEPETPYYFTIRGSFEDRITKNKDVRIFKTTQNDTLFLYSFINNQTLLVAGKESTLIAILNRLENRAFTR